jgi:Flp pilus assembly protein TadG
MKQFRLHRQGTCGQAMVWFMATIAATMAVLYGVYNVGQVTSAKQKVVNATDAGALAGATQQARLLNLMAYGNRAMVVSDAMAGQLVSLDSWMRYLQTTTQNVSHVSRLIPWVGQVLGTVLQTISRTLNRNSQTLQSKCHRTTS